MMRMKWRLVMAAVGCTVFTVYIAGAGQGAAGGEAVWVPNPLMAVYEGGDSSGTDDPKCVLKLAGTKGGAFSGQVVVQLGAPGKGPDAKITDLALKGGKASIPASAMEVRYALPTGVNGTGSLPKGKTIFDALDTKPREQGTVHPVWVTANVPADAEHGDYEGKLTIGSRVVPVTLSVAGWPLPKPQDYLTWVDFIESPESVALRYEVPMWSDKHFELMATVFKQLGKVGNKTLYLPLAAKSNLGYEQTIARWIKTDKEKEFKYDLVPMERYLDTCFTNAVKPAFVICHVYEDMVGGCMGWPPEKPAHTRGVYVSLLDPATGKTEIMEGPGIARANPAFTNYPTDTINFWKPVFDGLLERLKVRGLGEENVAAGLSRDMVPLPQTADALLAIAPYIKWANHAHSARIGLHRIKGGLTTTVWNARFPKDPAAGRTYGWQNKGIVMHNDRDIWKPNYATQLVRSRLLGELNIAGQQRGFGRMSADFWPCIKDAKGNFRGGIASRFPDSNWSQLNLNQTAYLYPGPSGALGTIRFEMLREGVQECEARIYIEKALLDKAVCAKLGEELAKRCQDLLDERVRALLASMSKGGKSGDGLQESTTAFADGPWQERSAKLYAAAAEVAKMVK